MTIGLGSYCALHTRVIYNKAFEWMTLLPTRLGSKWPTFSAKIKALFISSEEPEVSLDSFEKLCEEFGISIANLKDIFYEAFPGQVDGNNRYIEMSHLNEIIQANEINQLYDKVDLSDDDEGVMGDFSGYTGIAVRDFKDLKPITYEEFVGFIQQDCTKSEGKTTFENWKRSIRDIDQDNNGYVTTTELEDILKIHYPNFQNRNLKKMFKPFASIQNRILIDYKKFRKDLIDKIKDSKEDKDQVNPEKNKILSLAYPKKSKTKLNSLTLGNLNKLDDVDNRTIKKNEDDDVISHVSISKASIHSKGLLNTARIKDYKSDTFIPDVIKEEKDEEPGSPKLFSNQNIKRV